MEIGAIKIYTNTLEAAEAIALKLAGVVASVTSATVVLGGESTYVVVQFDSPTFGRTEAEVMSVMDWFVEMVVGRHYNNVSEITKA